MKKHDATLPNPESVTEVSQEKTAPVSSASKFTPAHWRDRIYRRTYESDGSTTEVQEYRAKIQHAGKREEIGLGTNDREAASRRAAKLYSRVKAAGWAVALAEFAPDRNTAKGVPTVGEVIEAGCKQATDVSAIALRGYCVNFRKIAADAYGVRSTSSRFDYRSGGHEAWRKRVDSIRLDKLTTTRIQNVLNRQIAAAKGNPLAQRSARVTAHAKLQKVKALFKAARKHPFENLPNPFAGVAVEISTPPKYVSTVKAGDLMRAAQTELATEHPEAYKTFLLALGAGLRAAEIDNLQWQQIDANTNTVHVMTTATFKTKTESSEREVFVDAGLIAELEQFRKVATSLYVLESERQPKPGAAVASYRAEIAFNFLKKWLRAHGVTARKPIHTLRKEFGSLVCESSDIFTASRQLGHASIALTATYYAENRRRVAPQIGAMLNPTTEPEKGKAAK